MVEWGRLLSGYRGKTRSRVRIPPSPLKAFQFYLKRFFLYFSEKEIYLKGIIQNYKNKFLIIFICINKIYKKVRKYSCII